MIFPITSANLDYYNNYDTHINIDNKTNTSSVFIGDNTVTYYTLLYVLHMVLI